MSKQPTRNRLIDEASDEAPPAIPPQRAEPSETRKPRRSQGKGAYPGRRQVTSHIDEKLFRWLKMISVETDTPMVEIHERALLDFVETYKARKQFGQG